MAIGLSIGRSSFVLEFYPVVGCNSCCTVAVAGLDSLLQGRSPQGLLFVRTCDFPPARLEAWLFFRELRARGVPHLDAHWFDVYRCVTQRHTRTIDRLACDEAAVDFYHRRLRRDALLLLLFLSSFKRVGCMEEGSFLTVGVDRRGRGWLKE